MPQPLFQAKQHGLLIPGLGVDDAIGMQTGAGERRGEQVARPQAPQDRARHEGEDAGGEQHCGGAISGTTPRSGRPACSMRAVRARKSSRTRSFACAMFLRTAGETVCSHSVLSGRRE